MPDSNPKSLVLDGISCASCVSRAERAIADVPGVEAVAVNLATRVAHVDARLADWEPVEAALIRAGYPARATEAMFDIKGMTCAGCAGKIEAGLRKVDGVLEVVVNVASRTGHIRYFDGIASTQDIETAIASAGYAGRLRDSNSDTDVDIAQSETLDARRSALIALALTFPVFLLEMGGHLFPPLHHAIGHSIGHEASWFIQFALTSLVLAGPGAGFFRKGVPAVLRGAPDMNSLVALGTSAAWGYSCVALFLPGVLPESARSVYFEAAAVIVSLILLGRWLEARARGQAGAAIETLIGLQPKTAMVERDGNAVEVPITDVIPGDVLRLRPGERVAADGTVIGGTSYVDESMITGEPAPVSKSEDDAVVAGTVNGSGALQYRADKVGQNTVLAGIVMMVQQARGAKLPVQALADKVVLIFVPVVMILAALTVAVWLWFGPDPRLSFALVAGVSVLIIACPCAMGLATPTSIIVGTGRGAELSVLFRKGDALQTLGEIGMVIFDKTGTLTLGRPVMTDFVVVPGGEADDVLAVVAAAEALSEHPIAHAVCTEAESRGLTLPEARDVKALDGRGLHARVDGSEVLIGSAHLMRERNINTSALSDVYAALQTDGKSPVFVAVDDKILAVFGVSDPIKPNAQSAVAALKDQGVKVAMVTGDAVGTAQSIARRVDIDHVEAEVLPEGKRDAVRRLQKRFGAVAFVGDGINDAPALAHADVGIAIGTGTDVAIESADVVLMSGDLRGVVNAFAVSQKTMTNIKQNLGWAFGYNVALIPVSAGVLFPVFGVLLSPGFAAAAMALSSVTVLGNALRLRRVGVRA